MTGTIRFKNFSLFDGVSFHADTQRVLTIEGGKIVSLAATDAQENYEAIDLCGATLMPGLIDAHFHCNSPSLDVGSIDRLYPSHLAQFAREHLEQMLLRGFTTVRDAGGADYGLVQAIEAGYIKGPRLYISGKALSQTGGHGDLRGAGEVDPCGCSYKGALAQVVDGPEEMRKAVRDELRKGAHQIKLFVSGGVLSPTDPIWMDQFTFDEIKAAVEEAATRRTYVMAHAHTANASVRCARAGVRSIEHGTLIDRDAADIVAEKGAYVVPTITVMESLLEGGFDLPKAAAEKLKAIIDDASGAIDHCMAAGVKLGLGTDLFGALHGRELHELTARARINGALETLRSATSVNAEILQRSGELGVIRAGALADIIAVSGNPTENIELFNAPEENISLIMKDGEIIKNNFKMKAA